MRSRSAEFLSPRHLEDTSDLVFAHLYDLRIVTVEMLPLSGRNPRCAARAGFHLGHRGAAYRVTMDLIRMAAVQGLGLTVADAFRCPQPSFLALLDAARCRF